MESHGDSGYSSNPKALDGVHKNNENFFTKPICDKATFDRIQVLLKQNSGNRGRFGSDYVNIFRGLECPVCKGSMSAGVQFFNSKNGKRKKEPYRYLRCSSVSNSIHCSNRHNFNLKGIEAEFFAVFRQQDPETVQARRRRSETKGNHPMPNGFERGL